jgi:pimeloyl-ACP methyl ester carboxylesterase
MSTNQTITHHATTSRDGTTLAYQSLGSGPGVIVFGGVLSEPDDYLPLAQQLAADFTIHVIARRGRTGSAPMCAGHQLADECDDLHAVARATGARRAFGHSLGGRITLEAARHGMFDRIVVFEPGFIRGGQPSTAWLGPYAQLLARGRRREAFALMVRHSPYAPLPARLLPTPLLAAAMRLAIPDSKSQPMSRLLEANLVEHQLLLDSSDSPLDALRDVSAATLLLSGARSPRRLTGPLNDELAGAIPSCTVSVLHGVGHDAPINRPDLVAGATRTHFMGQLTAPS